MPVNWSGLSITARWPMDNANVSGTTITDVVGTNHATAAAGIISAANAFGGTARQMPAGAEGNGYMTLGSNPIADLGGTFSFAVWIYLANCNEDTDGGNRPRLCGFQDGSKKFTIVNNKGSPAALGGGNEAGTTANRANFSAAAFLPSATWVHIAVTYSGDGSGVTIVYKNGSSFSTTTDSEALNSVGNNNLSGQQQTNVSWASNTGVGRLYQFVIAGATTWTPTQVLQIYNNDANPSGNMFIPGFTSMSRKISVSAY